MICTKCRKTVKVITKFLDNDLVTALEKAQQITNEVAKVIHNPLFELLISQLPAGINVDSVLAIIEKVLSVSNSVTACKDVTGLEKINCLMRALNLLPKDERNSALLRLKSALVAYLDGGRYTPSTYDTAAQLDYFNHKVMEGNSILAEDQKEIGSQEINVIGVAAQMLTEDRKMPEVNVTPSHAMPLSSIPEATPPTPQAF